MENTWQFMVVFRALTHATLREPEQLISSDEAQQKKRRDDCSLPLLTQEMHHANGHVHTNAHAHANGLPGAVCRAIRGTNHAESLRHSRRIAHRTAAQICTSGEV